MTSVMFGLLVVCSRCTRCANFALERHLMYAVSLMTLLRILGPFHICWTEHFEITIKMGPHAYFSTKFALLLGQDVKGRMWHN